VGAALVEHPDVDMISFTGGAKTGRSIAATAGGLLKPVNLELGGKSPNIVFADVDLDPTIARVADAIFSSGGQSCTAGSRIFVEEKIYKPVLAGLNEFARNYRMGDPASSDTDMGPLASFAHREKVASYIDIGKAEGAKIEVGGYVPSEAPFAKGAFYPATVMTEVDNRARVSSEEIFGPVAVVLPFRDEEDVIAQANDTPYGLAAGLWTADPRRAVRIASNLRAGTVWVNTFKQFSIATPFGGMKQSGIGREKGIQGMRVYMAAKGIYLAD
jgi:betaine-aldehyde dehydrogenase